MRISDKLLRKLALYDSTEYYNDRSRCGTQDLCNELWFRVHKVGEEDWEIPRIILPNVYYLCRFFGTSQPTEFLPIQYAQSKFDEDVKTITGLFNESCHRSFLYPFKIKDKVYYAGNGFVMNDDKEVVMLQTLVLKIRKPANEVRGATLGRMTYVSNKALYNNDAIARFLSTSFVIACYQHDEQAWQGGMTNMSVEIAPKSVFDNFVQSPELRAHKSFTTSREHMQFLNKKLMTTKTFDEELNEILY